ncbi:ABC transporter, solute-binding protein [Treponema phagedenis F0421]|nr:ABC transporter, solute-binding protein [Treponema phagedenis F0421]
MEAFMKQKIIHTVLLLFVVAIAFIGCSKAETAGEKEAGTLVYWSMWEATEPQGQVIQEAISQFTADTGIAVDAQFKGRTGIREGLQPALDAGSNIDLFDEDIDRVNATWKAYLLDLEDFAKNANYEATANAGLIAACRKAGEGKLKSIPYQPNIFAIFYNKAIFDQAGVTAVPKTWEELDAACQKIKNAGFVPITNDDAYITCLFGYHMSRINGYEKTEAIVKGNQWDDPSVAETAKAYADFAKKGYFSPNIGANVWPAGQNQELAMGTAAMYLNGSWLPNEVISMTGDDFEWGCFSYPAVANGHDGVEASNFGAQVFAINKNSKNAEAAFKLITYITKGRFDKELSARSLGIPADSTNTDWPKQLKNVRPVMESLKTRYPWAAGAEANPDMTPIIKENMMKLCAGTITAEQFTANLKAASK